MSREPRGEPRAQSGPRPALARAAAVAGLLALAPGLFGCGPAPSGQWSKEGASEASVKRDQKACVAEAGDYGFLVSQTGQVQGSTVAARQQGDIYRSCMTRKGYSEYAPGSLPQSKAPSE